MLRCCWKSSSFECGEIAFHILRQCERHFRRLKRHDRRARCSPRSSAENCLMKLFDFSSKMTPVFTSLQCTIFQSSKVIDYGLFNGPVNFSYFYNTTKSHTQSTIQKVLKEKSLPFKTPKLPSIFTIGIFVLLAKGILF